MTYDIACSFQPWLAKRDPALLERLSFVINAFHIYGHGTRCQLNWNPRSKEGLGMFDGEQCERDWSLTAHLVAPGQISSRAHREAMLHHLNIHKAKMHRLATPFLHKKKLKRAQLQLSDSLEKIGKLFQKHSARDDSDTINDFEHKLLLQYEFQKKYFDRRTQKLERSVELDKMIAREMLVLALERGNLMDLALSIIDDFPPAPNFAIEHGYDEASRERLDNLLHDSRRSLRDLNPMANLAICIREHVRSLWQALEDIRDSIRQEFNSRALELCIRSRTKGQKAAKKVIQSIQRPRPRLVKQIEIYNEALLKIPSRHRLSIIDSQNLQIDQLEKTLNKPLWQFEFSRAAIFNDIMKCDTSPDTLNAIDHLHKKNRAQEEIVIIDSQCRRIRDWIEIRLQTLLDVYHVIKHSGYVVDLLLDAVVIGERICYMTTRWKIAKQFVFKVSTSIILKPAKRSVELPLHLCRGLWKNRACASAIQTKIARPSRSSSSSLASSWVTIWILLVAIMKI